MLMERGKYFSEWINALSMIPGYVYSIWFWKDVPLPALSHTILCTFSSLYHLSIHYQSPRIPYFFQYDLLAQQWSCLVYTQIEWLKIILFLWMMVTGWIEPYQHRRWIIPINGITILIVSSPSIRSVITWCLGFGCFILHKRNVFTYPIGHAVFHLFGHLALTFYTLDVLL